MPNTTVRAAAEGLPKITRRLFLRNTAVVSIASATVVAPAAVEAAPATTPDQRIAAAIEMIKAAYQDKFPGAPIRVCTHDDDGGVDMVMVVPFPNREEQTGIVTYMHNCKVVRREGGAS